jgi:hypothetical protein
MAKTITYICDRCGAEKQDNDKFLHVVQVSVFNANQIRWVRYWCEPCMTATGLFHLPRGIKPENAVPPAPLTLEEVIRQIVREEIKEQP